MTIVAALAVTVAPMTASAAPIDWRGLATGTYGQGNYGQYNNGGNERISGVIASVNGGAVTLRNGRTVFLKNYTSIAPNGQGLAAGERISVSGTDAGNGNINANAITIASTNGGYGNGGYGNNNGYGNGNGYGNNGYGRGNDDNENGRGKHKHHGHRDGDDRGDGNRRDDR